LKPPLECASVQGTTVFRAGRKFRRKPGQPGATAAAKFLASQSGAAFPR